MRSLAIDIHQSTSCSTLAVIAKDVWAMFVPPSNATARQSALGCHAIESCIPPTVFWNGLSSELAELRTGFLRDNLATRIAAAAKPLSHATSTVVTGMVDYLKTAILLHEADQISSPVKAYNQLAQIVTSESCNCYAIATYLESAGSQYRDVLLSCMADMELDLPVDLSHCLVGLLHSPEDKIVNCAVMAMMAGGEYSARLMREAIDEQGLSNAKSFIRAYSELL